MHVRVKITTVWHQRIGRGYQNRHRCVRLQTVVSCAVEFMNLLSFLLLALLFPSLLYVGLNVVTSVTLILLRI